MAFITLLLVGFLAGILARLFVPGSNRMSWFPTLLLGVAGSLVGGFIGKLFEGKLEVTVTGIFGSVTGAVILLIIYQFAMASRTPA